MLFLYHLSKEADSHERYSLLADDNELDMETSFRLSSRWPAAGLEFRLFSPAAGDGRLDV